MITTAHDTRTREATHLALIGASSPALTFQSGSDTEKYRTAIAPIVMKMTFGTNVIAFKYRKESACRMSIPVKTFITTPKTPMGSNRCTAEDGTDFQKPRTRSETAKAVPKINEKPK